jgi:hypothetical protein
VLVLYSINFTLPLLALGVVAASSAVASYLLPYDTLNRTGEGRVIESKKKGDEGDLLLHP